MSEPCGSRKSTMFNSVQFRGQLACGVCGGGPPLEAQVSNQDWNYEQMFTNEWLGSQDREAAHLPYCRGKGVRSEVGIGHIPEGNKTHASQTDTPMHHASCMHAHTHTHAQKSTQARRRAGALTHTQTHTHMHTHTCTHTHIYTRPHTCIQTGMYTRTVRQRDG